MCIVTQCNHSSWSCFILDLIQFGLLHFRAQNCHNFQPLTHSWISAFSLQTLPFSLLQSSWTKNRPLEGRPKNKKSTTTTQERIRSQPAFFQSRRSPRRNASPSIAAPIPNLPDPIPSIPVHLTRIPDLTALVFWRSYPRNTEETTGFHLHTKPCPQHVVASHLPQQRRPSPLNPPRRNRLPRSG